MKRVRLFISSPGDVADERGRALAVVERLQQEFTDISLEPLSWDQDQAPADPPSELQSPADFDIYTTVIGGHLGASADRADGSPDISSTESEFETAVTSHRANGKPDLLVYRK